MSTLLATPLWDLWNESREEADTKLQAQIQADAERDAQRVARFATYAAALQELIDDGARLREGEWPNLSLERTSCLIQLTRNVDLTLVARPEQMDVTFCAWSSGRPNREPRSFVDDEKGLAYVFTELGRYCVA